jgi:hypothetical protein
VECAKIRPFQPGQDSTGGSTGSVKTQQQKRGHFKQSLEKKVILKSQNKIDVTQFLKFNKL